MLLRANSTLLCRTWPPSEFRISSTRGFAFSSLLSIVPNFFCYGAGCFFRTRLNSSTVFSDSSVLRISKSVLTKLRQKYSFLQMAEWLSRDRKREQGGERGG